MKERARLTRRKFIAAGGAILAAGPAASSLAGESGKKQQGGKAAEWRVQKTRLLGRTGFRVGDISMGCGEISDANVVRYAYDHGVNLFDTAEGYGEGDSERKIGQALKHIDREKVFIVTKLHLEPGETERKVRDRFTKCLERLNTPYADALYLHAATRKDEVKHPGFHAAVARLKKDGKLRFAGISSHGPRGAEGDSMADVLLAAVADGRFDLMLLVYNFMNADQGKKVLRACREKNIGTCAMKVTAGVIKIEPFDPENPTGRYARFLERMMKRGMKKADAVARIRKYLERQREAQRKARPFVEKYGIKTDEQLKAKSIQWALGDEDMHTVCVSMPTFDDVERYVPLSGTRLSAADADMLERFARSHDGAYCRHGCNRCALHCPERLPVNDIMRYAVYFDWQHRQKSAMQKYARLSVVPEASCLDCDAPCEAACPHGVPVRAALLQAHDMLTLA